MELEKNTTLKIESAEISHETTIFAEPVYHYKNFLITKGFICALYCYMQEIRLCITKQLSLTKNITKIF